jgi:serine/threonine-protein kinase
VYAALANPDAAIEPASVRTIVEGPGDDLQGVVSPDGRYMAYQSDESGGYQIYIRRFPDGEGKWQASVAGGAFPRWSRDGRELFFSDLSTNDLIVVPVQPGANITLGSPQRLFSANAIGAELSQGFDVAPDGKEFVVVLNGASSGTEKVISIVQNWFAEFKSR